MAGRGRRGGQGPLSTPRTTLSDRGETPSLLGSALLRCRLRARMATSVGAVPKGHAGQPRSECGQNSVLPRTEPLKRPKSGLLTIGMPLEVPQFAASGRLSGRGSGFESLPLRKRSEPWRRHTASQPGSFSVSGDHPELKFLGLALADRRGAKGVGQGAVVGMDVLCPEVRPGQPDFNRVTKEHFGFLVNEAKF